MSKVYYNPNISQIRPYVPGKTEEAIQREYSVEHVIKLCSNENPFGPSPAVAEAVAKAVAHGHRYPDDASPELRALIAKRWNINTNQLQLGVGSSELIDMIIQAFVNPGGEMIVTEHGFALYRVLGSAHNAKITTVKDREFHQDLEAILSAITADTRVIFIANPNNPTGTWIPTKQFEDFMSQVPSHVIVVADEAYVDYMNTPEYYSLAQHSTQYPNLIVLHTLSKAYGLAGFRFGYSISQDDIAEQLNKARKTFNVSSITLAAAHAAINDQEYVKRCVNANQQGMGDLKAFLNQHRISTLAESGNFLTAKFGEQANHLAEKLIAEGVVVRPLTPYNMSEYLRISIGTYEENQALMQALTKYLTA